MNKIELQERLKKLEEKYRELEQYAAQLDSKQLAQKVYINATYGAFGNKNNPLGDDDIASSVTLTGQAVIKQSNIIAKQFIRERVSGVSEEALDNIVIYNDTDSVVGETSITTNKGIMPIETLFDVYNSITNKKISSFGHEIINVEDNNLTSLTFDSRGQAVVMGKVKNLIRHRVSKRKFKIKVNGHEVIMTEDHGCMVVRDGKLIRVSPKDIRKTDKMVVYDDSIFPVS